MNDGMLMNPLSKNGYSDVNGIHMYYELYGEGKPLVLLHGGGSTIQTSFGRLIPMLSRRRQLVCVELQAHGRTGDRDSSKLMNMFQKCADRMIDFKDVPDEHITSIQSPVLLVNDSADVATSEHMVAMANLIPDCTLLIMQGGHGEYMGEITTLKSGNTAGSYSAPMLEAFLGQ